MDDAAHLINKLGQVSWGSHRWPLLVFDLQEAYRSVPVHPADQAKLGVQWQGTTYIDRALPFGLRSAPKLFSVLTDGFIWYLHNKGIQFAFHYLDGFLLLGPAGSRTCQEELAAALTLCDQVGLPVAPGNRSGHQQRPLTADSRQEGETAGSYSQMYGRPTDRAPSVTCCHSLVC